MIGSFDPTRTTARLVRALGERVWALQVFHPRLLLFSAWLEDTGNPTNTWPSAWPAYVATAGPNVASNSIFVTTLNSPNGAFLNTTALVEVLPETGGYSNPCSDIRFSPDNQRMLLAERSMWTDTLPYAHESEVLEYVGGTPANLGAWTPSANDYFVGVAPHRNAAGGWTDCGYRVLATGDALRYSRVHLRPAHPVGRCGRRRRTPATCTT